jgi:hypothetical protein
MAGTYSRPYQVAGRVRAADAALPSFSGCETLAMGWQEGSASELGTRLIPVVGDL